MKNVLTLTTFLLITLLCGCKQGQTTHDERLTQGEVIVTGHIKNRDFYPHVEEIVLKLPFFKEGQVSYTAPIDADNSFYFNFQLHAEMCEVAINPYMEHLYVQPGDSIHLEIDFKDMLNPIVTGNGAELNRQFTLYTEGGYYMQEYRIWTEFKNNEEFDSLMEKEYQERLRRYDEFVTKHHPDEKVKAYIGQLIKADYYTALFEYSTRSMLYRIEDMDIHRYADKLAEAAQLLDNQVITNAHFRLSENMHMYLDCTHENFLSRDRQTTLEDVLAPIKDTPAMPYLFAHGLASSLYHVNDTTYFDTQKENFDKYIDSPYLRNSILQLQQSKKNFQENPKPVSDYILYGRYQDQGNSLKAMPYMTSMYDMLNKYRGKMIYLDFWAPWCPPCLAEMEPLKKLRQQFRTEDIVFITICRGENRERFEQVLQKYGMHVQGIEHILSDDLSHNKELYRMYNQLNVNSLPHYFIINREGVIVNYGSMMRPSYPGTAECIKKWL